MDTAADVKKADGQEHILVCLSISPSNAKIVRTAAKMAQAFGGSFTALYVQTSDDSKMSDEDKKRLQHHIRLAEHLGADIAMVHGTDVSYQIAEFARLSKVTKIVIGRNGAPRRHFWSKPTLTEKLIVIAPDLDIYIIPDSDAALKYRKNRIYIRQRVIPTLKDLLVTAALLAVTTLAGAVLDSFGFERENIITVYILGALLTSLFTKSYICSIINSLFSVILFNFLFTEPRFTLHSFEPDYTVTFAILLIASLITGTLTSKLKYNAKLSAQSAFRTKILFDTNQLLQKAKDDNDVINITASQLMKLLDRDIIAYPETDGKINEGIIFSSEPGGGNISLHSQKEREVAEWVFENRKRAGATTDIFKDSRCLYLSIRINSKVFGVVGIYLGGGTLDAFENSVLLSILGECALAIENIRNAKEKEHEAVRAKNEQLRADLLRAISHDLRTPLTAISGNAGYLLSDYKKLDDNMRTQIFSDIYDDSLWLISLVENLLSITRIEEGRIQPNMTYELIDEVIEDAIRHIRKKDSHKISVERKDELLLVKMDARLIIQVIMNLVDNAVKYTPAGTKITVSAEKREDAAAISVADNGNGIPDKLKPRVFEMFFSGENSISDSRRSMGLGLALCKSIVNLHGGEITLRDNLPHGSVFTFTLPLSEVSINE